MSLSIQWDDALATASRLALLLSRRPLQKSSPSARRELVWRYKNDKTVSLEEIAHRFQEFLLQFSIDVECNRCFGRYNTVTDFLCPTQV